MCVIVVKPAGVALPDYETFAACWDTNPDGFGMMYSDGSTVTIDKGYMGKEAAWLAMSKTRIDQTCVYHFRISTSGLVDSGACHPYPISSDARQLRQLYMKGLPYAVAHNGVIGRGGSVLNDTQLWVQHELVHNMTGKDRTSKFLDKSAKAHHSRFVILYGDGSYHLAGTWTDYDGLMFSNNNWGWRDSYGATPKASEAAFNMADEWEDWGYTYEDAVFDGYVPTCPACMSDNTVAHIESMIGLCECLDCSTVFNGKSKDIYSIDHGVSAGYREINRSIRKAAYYGV